MALSYIFCIIQYSPFGIGLISVAMTTILATYFEKDTAKTENNDSAYQLLMT